MLIDGIFLRRMQAGLSKVLFPAFGGRGDWQNQINHLLIQEEVAQRELSAEVREALLQLSA
ncbi:MAG: hypothetical protein NVS4B7_13880 [Ktedonobacteraceae bacterium]